MLRCLPLNPPSPHHHHIIPPDWEYLAGDCPGSREETQRSTRRTRAGPTHSIHEGQGVKGGQRVLQNFCPRPLLGHPRPVPCRPSHFTSTGTQAPGERGSWVAPTLSCVVLCRLLCLCAPSPGFTLAQGLLLCHTELASSVG